MGKNPDRPKKKTAKRKYMKPGGYDFTVLFIVLTLVLFGIVMIFSSSYYHTMTSTKFKNDMFYFLKRQSVWAVFGVCAMVVGMTIPYHFWKRFANHFCIKTRMRKQSCHQNYCNIWRALFCM